MPSYPGWISLEAIGDRWPGELTPARRSGQFKASRAVTLQDLGTEIERLLPGSKTVHDADVRVGLPVLSEQITLDGQRLRAGVEPWHPGLTVSFTIPRGTMRFAADQYTRESDNLRAVALTLEALRAVERWGATHGEQYNGYLAIESSRAMPTDPFTDAAGARRWLGDLLGMAGIPEPALSDGWRSIIRKAQAHTHPDHHPDRRDEFERVMRAAALIENEARA